MPARVLHALVSLFAETVRGWSRRNPDLLSAALALNTLFSLAPLLLLFITIAGEQYRSQVIGQIVMAVDRWGGPAIAGLVADLLAGMQRASAGPLVTLATAVILAWSASGMVLLPVIFSSSQSPSSCCPRATSAGGICGPTRC